MTFFQKNKKKTKIVKFWSLKYQISQKWWWPSILLVVSSLASTCKDKGHLRPIRLSPSLVGRQSRGLQWRRGGGRRWRRRNWGSRSRRIRTNPRSLTSASGNGQSKWILSLSLVRSRFLFVFLVFSRVFNST